MFSQQGVPLPVREDNGCMTSGAAACLIADQFRCEHGVYNVYLPVNCSAFPFTTQQNTIVTSSHRLVGQLVTVDSTGTETRDKKAQFDLYINIEWPANSCP